MDAAAVTKFLQPRQPMVRHLSVAVLAGVVLYFVTVQLST